MRISDEQPADTAEGHGYWPGRDVAEHQRQWEWFRSRWNSHDEAVAGPLEVQWAQLDREPPFAVIGSEERRAASSWHWAGRMSRSASSARKVGGKTLPSAARTLGVSPVDMDRARAAILDGLERSKGSPADPRSSVLRSTGTDLRRSIATRMRWRPGTGTHGWRWARGVQPGRHLDRNRG